MISKNFTNFLGALLILIGNPGYAKIIFDGRFDQDDFSNYRVLETNGRLYSGKLEPEGVPNRLVRTVDPAGSQKLVARATYIFGDESIYGGYRSEVSAPKDPIGSERWYSWSYYLPEEIKNNIVIAQIHHTVDVGESSLRSSTMSVWIQDNKIKLVNAYDYDKITAPAGVRSILGIDYTRRELASWDLETGKWVNLTLHVKWAGDDSGFLEFWKDGILFFEEKNHINTFNDEQGLWFKSGVYDMSNAPESVSTYFTGVLIGDEKETFRSISLSLVPEPMVYSMMIMGLLGIGYQVRTRNSKVTG